MTSEIRAQNYYAATQSICVPEIFILCRWLFGSDAWRELQTLLSTDVSPVLLLPHLDSSFHASVSRTELRKSLLVIGSISFGVYNVSLLWQSAKAIVRCKGRTTMYQSVIQD